jgi:glucose-6-phosphate 1-dehydrogenase
VNRNEERRDFYERMPYPTPFANLETYSNKLEPETVLRDALVGDNTHFTRPDGAEETWRIMPAFLDAPPPVHRHAPGSWCALKAADQLVAGHGRWHGPWVTA